MVPSGFFSTKKIVQIWKDFGAFLRREALCSNDCKLLEVYLIEDFNSRTASAGAMPAAQQHDVCSIPQVSQDDIARFQSFKESYAVKNVGRNTNADLAAGQSTTKRAGYSTVRACDLTDADGVSFTQCTFQCPAPWCVTKFDPKATLSDFLLHVEEPAHAKWLLTQEDVLACQFRCRLAFVAE
ncbi:hypothetical protein KCV07_g6915, partial [Aureobasidium melanogenum]